MFTSVRPSPVALSVPAALLDTSEIGIAHFDPVFAADSPADVIDLAYVRLNPAAQRLLRLPEFPTETLRVLAPQETAFFAFCHDAFQAKMGGTYDLTCPDEQGHSQVVRVVAQRLGPQLVASFTPVTGGVPAPTPSAPTPAWRAGPALWGELQQVFEQAPVAISIAYGPRLIVEVANAEMLALWSRAPEEVLGKPFFEALPETQDQGLEALLEEVLQTGTPWVAQERPAALRRNGQLETRCFNFVYHPLRDGDGRVAGVITVATEATPLVRARHQLRALDSVLQATHEALDTNTAALAQAQEAVQYADWQLDQERETFYQVFAQTPAAICFLRGPEYYYEYFNAAYQELFPGYQLLGRRVAEVMPETLEQGFVALLDHVYTTGETYHGTELPLVLAPAAGQPPHTFYFNFTYQAYQKNGQTAGITVFAYNVTEQVLARQQREAQRTEWQRLFEQVPIGIAVLQGPRYAVEFANAALCALWARSPAQVLGRPLFEVLPEAAGQGIEALLAGVLATGAPAAAREQPSFLDCHGRRDAAYWDFVYEPLRDAAGQLTGITMVVTEVSNQVIDRNCIKHLNEELQAANAELRQLNQELEARVGAGVEVAQQARAEAERQAGRLERFFQQAPAAICLLDGPDLVYELVNPGYEQLFPGRALLGRPIREARPELAGHATLAQLRSVYETGDTYVGHEVLMLVARPDDGGLESRYFNCVYQARYDEHGRIDGVLVFALDVTEQVQSRQRAEALQAQLLAAAQLRGQEREMLYQVFAQTPAIIAQLRGAEHRVEYVNAAYQELFPGRPLVGLPIAEALPEAALQGFVALLDTVYSTGQTYAGTETLFAISQPDGQPPLQKFITFTYQAYREHDQTVGILVFAYEVTEQVLARQQREAGLSQLQLVLEHAPVALALLQGPNYEVEVANPAICAFWGRERAQVLGRPLFEVLPEVVDQGYPGLLDGVRRTGQPFIAEESPAQLNRQGRTETAYFNFVYQPLFDAQGDVTAVVVVAIDVSPQVLARQQVALANKELRAANTQLLHTNVDLDNFIYTASHDLKAPIANIESLLIMLRKQLPAEVRQQGLVPRVLGMMQGAIERFQLTIAQLTDLAQLQQAHAQPVEHVDLLAVVEAVRLDLAPQLEAADADLAVDVEACTTVLFAPQYLRSVVYNLLSNALKYRHPDRRPEIRLHCHLAGGHTVLAVHDNGLGLTPAQQDKLFGLFRRLHAHVEGSGVGLYMVKRMVENAGGTITVQSQPGVGSTFTVSFPAQGPSHA